MLFSTGDAIDRLAPRLPPALVAPEPLSWVRRVASALPEVTSSACLECRLGPGDDRIDFMVCVMADEGRAALAAGSPLLRESAAWSRAFDLGAAWAEPGSILHAQVPFVWLEVDVLGPPPEVPPPFVFFCVQPHFMAGPLGAREPGGPLAARASHDFSALAGNALSLLLGHPLAPPVERTLARCFEALPPSGHVLHVAPLDSRGLDGIRLVHFMPKGELLGYLERIGWPGSMRDVGGTLAALYPHTSHVGFHLDVGEEVSPMIGMQVYHPGADPRWEHPLEWLCARGVCTADKRAAVLGWPGKEHLTLPHHRWPSIAYRTLEIKVVSRPDAPMEAKVYLGFGHNFSLFGG
jgi:hypothetical protein